MKYVNKKFFYFLIMILLINCIEYSNDFITIIRLVNIFFL